MSRCFPFPPPGYEKKARPDDDANFLIKEKHKEKKHKKDKKDKEKKEKREKKGKERSSEKDREKKDRKRKHKDKDKNREKEEKKNSEEKKVVGPSSHRNGEKLGTVGIQVDQTQHGRLLLELEKRVGNQNGAGEIRNVDKSIVKELSVRSSGKGLESTPGIMVGNQKFKDNREENRVPNGQSLKVSAKHLENSFLGNILAKEQNIVEGVVCQDEVVSENRKERKDKNKHKSGDGRGDKNKHGDRERKSKSKDEKKKKEKMKEEKVKEVSNPLPSKLIENGNNAVDIQNDRGSYLFKGSNSNNGYLGKRKEPQMNGFEHGNGSPINKLLRPLSSSKVEENGSRNDAFNPGIRFAVGREGAVVKHKLDAKASCSSSASENGTKLNNRKTSDNYAPERQEALNSHHHRASESLSSSQPSLGVGRKLEHCQTAVNFTSKEQGMITNHKSHEKVMSSQPIGENGRKLESSQLSTFSSTERQRAVFEPKLDVQELRINGLGLRKSDACSMRHSPVADQLKETVETHLKPPHPDAKYLTEILSVPKVEWSDNDDQAWLFSREDHRGKKPKIDSATFEESKQVWAEALQLESADVIALPYVIPY